MDNNMFPTKSEAVELHLFAHKANNATLHVLATKLLDMVGIYHSDDGLESYSVDDTLAELPSVIKLSDDFIIDDGTSMYYLCNNKMFANIEICLKEKVTKLEDNSSLTSYVPIYELWAVRKNVFEGIEKIANELINKPKSIFPIRIFNRLRSSGAYRFPVEATKLNDKRYVVVQIYTENDKQVIFDAFGNIVERNIPVVSKTSDPCLFIGMLFNDGIVIVDVWFWNNFITELPLTERKNILKKVCNYDCIPAGICIETSRELALLEDGYYLIRNIDDTVDDVLKPFWFLYSPNDVIVGHPFFIDFYNNVEELEWQDLVELQKNLEIIPFLKQIQIHKRGDVLCVFEGNSPRNKAEQYGWLLELLKGIDEDFVLLGMVDNENVYLFDILLFDTDVLLDKDFLERTSILEDLVKYIDSNKIKLARDTNIEECVTRRFLAVDATRPCKYRNDFCMITIKK